MVSNHRLDKYEIEIFEKIGINPNDLTMNQIDAILEPVNAPENYHCDGEISPAQARFRWLQNLRKAGLMRAQIDKVSRVL